MSLDKPSTPGGDKPSPIQPFGGHGFVEIGMIDILKGHAISGAAGSLLAGFARAFTEMWIKLSSEVNKTTKVMEKLAHLKVEAVQLAGAFGEIQKGNTGAAKNILSSLKAFNGTLNGMMKHLPKSSSLYELLKELKGIAGTVTTLFNNPFAGPVGTQVNKDITIINKFFDQLADGVDHFSSAEQAALKSAVMDLQNQATSLAGQVAFLKSKGLAVPASLQSAANAAHNYWGALKGTHVKWEESGGVSPEPTYFKCSLVDLLEGRGSDASALGNSLTNWAHVFRHHYHHHKISISHEHGHIGDGFWGSAGWLKAAVGELYNPKKHPMTPTEIVQLLAALWDLPPNTKSTQNIQADFSAVLTNYSAAKNAGIDNVQNKITEINNEENLHIQKIQQEMKSFQETMTKDIKDLETEITQMIDKTVS